MSVHSTAPPGLPHTVDSCFRGSVDRAAVPSLASLNWRPQVTHDEYVVLSEILDAPDRLYDQETSVVDVRALLSVAVVFLRGTPHLEIVNKAEVALQMVISSLTTESERNDAALSVRDDLRLHVARAWGPAQIHRSSGGWRNPLHRCRPRVNLMPSGRGAESFYRKTTLATASCQSQGAGYSRAGGA